MSSTNGETGGRLRFILLTSALAASLGLHFIGKLPLGFALLIFFVGWPLGGTLVTIDDDFKGGWSNPDGTVRPPWLQAPFWGQIAAGLSLSFVGFAYDSGWRSAEAVPFWFLAAGGAFLAAVVARRKVRG